MGSSLLLKLARDSMLEVYQAKRIIDKEKLLQEHPILATPMACQVTIYLDEKPYSSYKSQADAKLIENIILAAKKAAFEADTEHILTSTQYLHAEIELTLFTPDGAISERDKPILNEKDALVSV